MSYFSAVRSLPEGSDSPSRLALAARRLGYSGIIICNHGSFGWAEGIEAACRIKNMEIVTGIEIVSRDQKSLYGRVSSMRERVPFIAVHGGRDAINRAACENPNVDVLLHPQDGRHGLGIAAAKSASSSKVAIAMDLSPLIRYRGAARARWMEVFNENLQLARKFDLQTVLTADVRSHLDLRSPREMVSMACVAGFSKEEAEDALKLSSRIVALNRRRWAGPGVEVL